jgi:hypothetical protein
MVDVLQHVNVVWKRRNILLRKFTAEAEVADDLAGRNEGRLDEIISLLLLAAA